MSKEGVVDLIKAVREYMSTKDIAQEIGVTNRVVNYWLSGKRNPDRINLNQLKGLLNERRGQADAGKKALEKSDIDGGKRIKKDLGSEFLRIDLEVRGAIKKGLYVALSRQNLGMWEKGELITATVGGVTAGKKMKGVNWSELSRQTGSDREDLAKWFSIYCENLTREQADEWVKKKTDKEVDKWSKKVLPTPKKETALSEGEDKGKGESEPHSESTPKESTVKCFSEHYDSRDPMWNQVEDCRKNPRCPMLTLCCQLGEIVDKDPRFRDKK